MIVVDTSALLAGLGEEGAIECKSAPETENEILVSAGTLWDAFIVAASRNIDEELADLVDGLDIVVSPVTSVSAMRIARAYRRRGKSFHPASLNFGDGFAYELATLRGCPLLYSGNEFVRTDVASAL